MFKPRQYRAKAVEYGNLAKASTDSKQRRNFQKLEHRFAALANNEQWLADNYQSSVSSAELERSNDITLPDEEEHILRCLGAALILEYITDKVATGALRQCRQHGRVVGDCCSERPNCSLSAQA